MLKRAALAGLLLLGGVPLLAAPASQPSRVKLRQTQQRQADQQARAQKASRQARILAGEAADLAARRVRQTQDLRAIEAEVVSETAAADAASARARAARQALGRHETDFSLMVPLALRMSRYPAETVLAVPAPPDHAVEGLLIARGLSAQLNQEAASLRVERDAANRLQTASEAELARLDAARGRQRAAAAALAAQLSAADAAASAAEQDARAAGAQVASLAAQAENLKSAITAMDAAQAAAVAQAAKDAKLAARHRNKAAAAAARAREAAVGRPDLPGQVPAAGKLVTPVAGPIVIGWGKAGEDGPATGITYAPPAGAYVSAPCAGRVAFAAPFHAYGKLVILECGGAYDVVLAGMDALVAPVGHSVRAGEPVGRMADFLSPAQGAPGAAKLQARSGLYMEIRSHGAAVDPSPFLNRRG